MGEMRSDYEFFGEVGWKRSTVSEPQDLCVS